MRQLSFFALILVGLILWPLTTQAGPSTPTLLTPTPTCTPPTATATPTAPVPPPTVTPTPTYTPGPLAASHTLITATPSATPPNCPPPVPLPTCVPVPTAYPPTPTATPTPTSMPCATITPTPWMVTPSPTPCSLTQPCPITPTPTPWLPTPDTPTPLVPTPDTPTAIPTTYPTFTATVGVTPHQPSIAVGETLSITVTLDVSEGCQLFVYELTLSQVADSAAPFAPEEVMFGPGVPRPETITFTAVTTGTTTFRAHIYGERYCGDYLNWTDVWGYSEPVSALSPSTFPIRLYAPFMRQD